VNRTQKEIEQDALTEKLQDLDTGFEVEMTPEEADRLGAFREQALSEQDAIDSGDDAMEDDDLPAFLGDDYDDTELPHRYTIRD
jgi:hypothetical protein